MKTYTYHLVGGFSDFDPSPAGPMSQGAGSSEFTADLIDVTFEASPDAFAASLTQTFGMQVDRHLIAEASAAGSTLVLLLRPATADVHDFSAYHVWLIPPRAADVKGVAPGTPVH